ncbi:papilin-like isoform X2 [Babylonia areolata]|uniref:papilin-like isoform X2 n=1 Tax=Babylonia areolata TaxID=304850 RepID=UPI003FD64EF6
MYHVILRTLFVLLLTYDVISDSLGDLRSGGPSFSPPVKPSLSRQPEPSPKCMLDCPRGYVPFTCLCQPESDPFPFLFPATPCMFANCPQGQACQMKEGKAVCVVISSTRPSVDVCNLPADPGPCEALIPSFFFDKKDGTCKNFTYGGCQGNENRFASREDCENTCIADVPAVEIGGTQTAGVSKPVGTPRPTTGKQNEICSLPAQTGLCRAYIPSFFFNSTSGQCQSYVYGGCGGNQNRFPSVQACQAACGGAAPSRSGSQSAAGNSPVLSANTDCNLPKVVGLCKAYMPSFFYNTNSGQCENFVYGGCGGNTNRFETKQQCEQKCKQTGTTTSSHSSANPTPSGEAYQAVHSSTGKQNEICSLPAQTGLCMAYIPSFFFNSTSGQCQSFVYGGCGGNQNRFPSVQACQAACGGAAPSRSGSQSAAGNSPVLSANTDCNLPKVVGLCKAYMPSFFYNTNSGQCENFVYGGCGGNANRFETKQQCEQKCKQTHTITPSQGQNTTCQQPREVGRCRARIQRWYFNQQSQTCQIFYYGGCGGNDNNFNTQADCEHHCRPVQVMGSATTVSRSSVLSTNTDCNLPKVAGLCKAHMPSFFYNTNSGQCENFVYGGCGGNANRFETKQQCEQKCKQTGTTTSSHSSANPTPSGEASQAVHSSTGKQNEICSLPAQTGLCRAYIPSFFFNSTSGQCQSFVYGGCGGNQNRFPSVQACQAACGGAAPSRSGSQSAAGDSPVLSANTDCNLPKVVGLCRAHMPSFYYNTNSGQCENFVYGGCGGNANRFETKQQCEQKCKPTNTTSPNHSSSPGAALGKVLASRDGNRLSADCNLPKAAGVCRAYIPSFYYNKNTGQCERFIYGGCRGNANRFETKQQCEQRCKQTRTITPSQGQNTTCQQPRQVGRCRARIQRWYFNQRSTNCQIFYYGGCGGNDNNFKSKADCEGRCVTKRLNVCRMPKVVGPCRAAFRRYFFNAETGRCERFTYGGCRGNQNNFQTFRACSRRCRNSQN